MSFIRDVTIGEGESVQPNTSFVKTWRIQNNGKNNNYLLQNSVTDFEVLRSSCKSNFTLCGGW